MTYEELWLNATYLLDHNKITLGEFEEMIEPLKHEISEQTEPQIDCRRCKHYATGKCKECSGYELFTDSGYVTDCSWR